MNRKILAGGGIAFVVVAVGGVLALGTSVHPPVRQPVHRSVSLAATSESPEAPSAQARPITPFASEPQVTPAH